MMRKTLFAAIAVSLMLSGCSWGIRLQPGGRAVRAAYVDSVAGCRQLGEVTVSVTDHVGPFDRNNLTVRDELEVLARNAGAGMGADTVKPLAAPVDGQQKWGAYRCGPAASDAVASAASTAPPALPGNAPAQTLPLKTQPLQIQDVPASAGSSAGGS